MRKMKKGKTDGNGGRKSEKTRRVRIEKEQEAYDLLMEALPLDVDTNVATNSEKRTCEAMTGDVHCPTVAPWNHNTPKYRFLFCFSMTLFCFFVCWGSRC